MKLAMNNINSRITEEKKISELENRKMDIIQSEQWRKQTEREKMNITSHTSETITKDLTFLYVSQKKRRKRA